MATYFIIFSHQRKLDIHTLINKEGNQDEHCRNYFRTTRRQ